MHIIKNIALYDLHREPRLARLIPENLSGGSSYNYGLGYNYGTSELVFFDKVIRRCKKSLYNDCLEESEHDGISYPWSIDARNHFYQNQIQEEANVILHDHTVMVTFDGINGAGKSDLIQLLEWFVSGLDQRSLYGGSNRLPPKISRVGAESIQAHLDYHAKKVGDKERGEIASLDFFGHLYQYALALTSYAAEQPSVQFVDRSYLTSLAKASNFIEQRKKEIYSRPVPKGKEKFIELEYLIGHMKDKYVVPDLSVILLCDLSASRKRQGGRLKRSKKVDKREIGWYAFFQEQNVIPNALYIDTASIDLSQAFLMVVEAFKERCDDKGGKQAEFAQKITSQSQKDFLAGEPAGSLIHRQV